MSHVKVRLVCWDTHSAPGPHVDLEVVMARVPIKGERIEFDYIKDHPLMFVHKVHWVVSVGGVGDAIVELTSRHPEATI
jgi:hypothetical protein